MPQFRKVPEGFRKCFWKYVEGMLFYCSPGSFRKVSGSFRKVSGNFRKNPGSFRTDPESCRKLPGPGFQLPCINRVLWGPCTEVPWPDASKQDLPPMVPVVPLLVE